MNLKIKTNKGLKFSKSVFLEIHDITLLTMIMPQSTLESLLFFLVLSLFATYIVNLKYASKLKPQK